MAIPQKPLFGLIAAAFAWVGIYQLHLGHMWFFAEDAVLSSVFAVIAFGRQ